MNNTYPEPYRSGAKNAYIDPSTCYSRECVSYTAWKIREAKGAWPKRTGDMNAKNWIYRLPSWGYREVSRPVEGGKYVGVLPTGTYGHVVWFESGSTISEYNYNYLGNYGTRAINLSQYRWFEIVAPPVRPPAPSPSPSPAPSGQTYTLNRSVPGYVSAGDAKAYRNSNSTVPAGTYSVFNQSNGMINITRQAGQPGWWINPSDNGAPAPSPAPSNEVYAIVQKGEGLSMVAQRMGIANPADPNTWARIASLNGSDNWGSFNRALQPGQRIRVQ